ncbi:MAG TPA: hypothetical protein VLX59_10360 [Acidimicrobiales bacterium]|nr:hypothetical protein [Acidimicrobiales bacterium]
MGVTTVDRGAVLGARFERAMASARQITAGAALISQSSREARDHAIRLQRAGIRVGWRAGPIGGTSDSRVWSPVAPCWPRSGREI